MSVYSHRGRDYLAFNATEWNAGPGTMVVEGFRSGGEETMEAFQYFLVDEEPVGRAPVGELEYHRGGGHNHWHFEEFTRYSLLDASSNEILRSGKQSWCLVNTDALDLSLPNAKLFGFEGDIATSCGFPGALWVREVLDVGWGDTYSQSVRGQAFDITGLPNGRYYVRVHVNPTGTLFEATAGNNVEDRLIRLRGRPGHRRVIVPPWHGIDTARYCYYCGLCDGGRPPATGAGRSSSSVASGRQRKRNGANLLVPSPGETWTNASPIRMRPEARRRGRCEFVTSAPTSGMRTWPPCV